MRRTGHGFIRPGATRPAIYTEPHARWLAAPSGGLRDVSSYARPFDPMDEVDMTGGCTRSTGAGLAAVHDIRTAQRDADCWQLDSGFRRVRLTGDEVSTTRRPGTPARG
jgi:hypothetical protein